MTDNPVFCALDTQDPARASLLSESLSPHIGGISGVAAAHRLAESVDVTLFEAQRRLGGHTDSHSVWVEDKVYTIDTGCATQRNVLLDQRCPFRLHAILFHRHDGALLADFGD